MVYSIYRECPGWATTQFQFVSPPTPTFVPQSSWCGLDYYNAHCPDGDENLFARTWDTVRRYPPGEFGPGLQVHDAQHWHQRAYGGLVELEEIEADKIGHAAAYEAHRIWHHHPHLYKHLTSTEQRRESFIALAIAEATKLMQYAGHRMDSFERTLIAESAAATASRIFHETMEPRHAQVIIPPPGPVIIDDSYHSGVVYIPPSPAPCCQI